MPNNEIAELNEQIRQLNVANKKLLRQLEQERAMLKRNQARVSAVINIQEVLKASKLRLEQYMNLMLLNTVDAMFVFDNKNRLVYASDVVVSMSGIVSIAEIHEKSVKEIFDTMFGENIGECSLAKGLVRTAIREEKSTECYFTFRPRGFENTRSFKMQITPMFGETKTLEGTLIIMFDTTEISRARDEAFKAREEAVAADLAKTRFLANMSHEMRTPLNAIIGMTSIARQDKDKMRLEYCMERIESASHHLLGIINDVLDMSKIGADKFELSNTCFAFKEAVVKTMDIVLVQSHTKNQHINLEYDEDIPEFLVGDEQRFCQVFMNLLSNAVKFTGNGGTVEVGIKLLEKSPQHARIQVDVKDNGIGISPIQIERLFTPFQQADSSTSRKFGGTGLGLSISKKIVEMMDGSIWVDSSEGNGSTFSFTISLASPGKDAAHLGGGDTVEPLIENEFSGNCILIAEDIEINREIICELLSPTGIGIDCAENGNEAYEMFTDNSTKYGMIFMDIQMPELDGYGATQKIRSSGLPNSESVPIIALTANAFTDDIEKCFAVGMNGHVGKPISINEVLKKMRKYLKDV